MGGRRLCGIFWKMVTASAVSGGRTHLPQPRRKSIYSPDAEEGKSGGWVIEKSKVRSGLMTVNRGGK